MNPKMLVLKGRGLDGLGSFCRVLGRLLGAGFGGSTIGGLGVQVFGCTGFRASKMVVSASA